MLLLLLMMQTINMIDSKHHLRQKMKIDANAPFSSSQHLQAPMQRSWEEANSHYLSMEKRTTFAMFFHARSDGTYHNIEEFCIRERS